MSTKKANISVGTNKRFIYGRKAKTINDQDEEYYSGCLYDEQNFLRFRLAKIFLSRVSIADEYVENIKKLSTEGIVVYAIKQRSKLNSLIIYELTGRKISRPVYCHGMNMSFWQPLPKMLKFLWSSFLRRFGKKQKACWANWLI